MSWFGCDLIASDEREEEAVAEGVVVQRRSVLKISAATIASAFTLSRGSAIAGEKTVGTGGSAEPSRDESLQIRELFSEMLPRARGLIASGGKQEESYLLNIAALLTRLQIPDQDSVHSTMMAFYKERGIVERRDIPVAVVLMKLAPGKGFSLHDHRDYNGVIMGVEGEARVRNFDIQGDELVPPKGTTFQIRQTRDDLILPGRFSTLGRKRENIHDLVAGPEGASVLDVFTFFDKEAKSYYLDAESEPRDAERGIFDAAWK